MELTAFLRLMVDKRASDMYFTTGAPPNIKVEGIVSPVGNHPLPAGEVQTLAYSVMNDDQRKYFERTRELDMGLSVANLGRFRVNVFRQRGEVAMVVRYLNTTIPTIEQLNLPLRLRDLVMEERGMVLVVGSTGSGKSTTLAAMIDYRNAHRTGHILTLEDPIEYLHPHKKSLVNQREIGSDTDSYDSALRRAMREAPDVILIGEIRDRDTMEHAITYADTGHLCLSTLHATNAYQTLERIINFFPQNAHHQILMDLSLNLRAIISQRLVIGVDGKRVPAVEILLNTPYVSELIQKGEIEKVRDVMASNADENTQTFDQSLLRLYKAGKISKDEALRQADSKNNVGVQMRMLEGGAASHPEKLSID